MKNGLKHYSTNDRIESKYNHKKIVLNNKNDLINIPIQQLRTAQLKNFCGKLFEQLYKEAMIIEHNQSINISKSSSEPIPGNNLKAKSGSFKIQRKKVTKAKTVEMPQNNVKAFENKIKPTSGVKKVVIKIIKKKVIPKKPLYESEQNVKVSPQLYNNTIIYKNITKNQYITENFNKVNSSPPYYHKMKLSFDDNDLIINRIMFSIKYDTTFGEEVGILGSIEKLGNWNQSGIFYLNWNNGNIWTGEIGIESPPKDFEFKFVISFNRYVKRWENGDNNKVCFDKLLNEIKNKRNGFFDKYEYRYDSAKGELYLKCKWD